jgi:hypothetical protein
MGETWWYLSLAAVRRQVFMICDHTGLVIGFVTSPPHMLTSSDLGLGHGSGSRLPLPVLEVAGISTIVAVIVSGISIWLQLRNYRKPLLQRCASFVRTPTALMLPFQHGRAHHGHGTNIRSGVLDFALLLGGSLLH